MATFSVLIIVEPVALVDDGCVMVRFTFSRARMTPQRVGISVIVQCRGPQRLPGGWRVSERGGSRDRVPGHFYPSSFASVGRFFFFLERFCLKIA